MLWGGFSLVHGTLIPVLEETLEIIKEIINLNHENDEIQALHFTCCPHKVLLNILKHILKYS